MVTQFYDMDHYGLVLTTIEKEDILNQPNIHIMESNAHHIIPLLSAPGPNSFNSSLNFILKFCSLQWDEFNENTHSLKNIMTLNSTIGPFFTYLHVWFEAVPVSTFSFIIFSGNNNLWLYHKGTNNTYKTCSWSEGLLLDMPPYVTFSTNTNLSLPDPKYLKIHAAICRVLSWSGAGMYVEVERERQRVQARNLSFIQ